MSLVLYYLDVSPPCRAVLMAIHLLGLKLETTEVNLLAGEHLTPQYLAKNPIHTIPLLEDNNVFIADSHAIITYLTSKYGGHAELYPSDITARSEVDQKLYFDATILFPRCRAILQSISTEKATAPSEDQIAKIEEAYGFLEKFLEKNTYIAADHLTVADVSCVATVTSMDFFVPIDKKYSKIHQWLERIKQNEWYQSNEPGLGNMDSFVKELIKLNSM